MVSGHVVLLSTHRDNRILVPRSCLKLWNYICVGVVFVRVPPQLLRGPLLGSCRFDFHSTPLKPWTAISFFCAYVRVCVKAVRVRTLARLHTSAHHGYLPMIVCLYACRPLCTRARTHLYSISRLTPAHSASLRITSAQFGYRPWLD